MYAIYINEFLRNNRVVTEEELMYNIPADYPEEEMLIDPKVKNEMGKAGTFEFSMEMSNPWYSSLLQMRTRFRVDYDGNNIFYGRVLSIDTDMYGRRKVHCEGALAFLLDTLMESTKEEERKKISLSTYVSDLVTSHNNITESWKNFKLGEVPGHYSQSINTEQKPVENENKKFGASSWTSVLNCLEDLTSKYGGYWRVRCKKENYVDTIGRYGQGNIDLNNRIVIHNDDGSISTERSFSVELDNKEVLLPTIVNGIIISQEAAIQHYHDSGEYLGKFDSVAEADIYAYKLHERQDWYYNGQKKVLNLYLDWLLNYFNGSINDQPIKLGENLIDISNTVDVNGIFTALIPEGTSKGKPLYLDAPQFHTVKTPVYKRVDDNEGS